MADYYELDDTNDIKLRLKAVKETIKVCEEIGFVPMYLPCEMDALKRALNKAENIKNFKETKDLWLMLD